MIKYFFKRLFQSAIVMLIVAFVSFSLFNFVGDPINNMVGEETSDEERSQLREDFGLNDPIHIQFSRFIVNFVNKEINNCDRGNDQTKTIWGDLCIDNWSSKKIINYINLN